MNVSDHNAAAKRDRDARRRRPTKTKTRATDPSAPANPPPRAVEPLENRVMLAAQMVTHLQATGASNPQYLVSTPDGTAFFAASNQLWRTDGTPAGTTLLKDFGASFDPRDVTVAGAQVFFSAGTAAAGRELWKTDGTEAGTALVKDIRPGAASSSPQRLTAVGSALYFIADNGTQGVELWKTNGTDAGTTLVRDIAAGSASAQPNYLVHLGGVLYFGATEAAGGNELWRSDGTAAGTTRVKDLRGGTASSAPADLRVSNGVLYFTADNGSLGRELYRSNGTDAGTTLVRDLVGGGGSSTPQSLTDVGGVLYFSATTSSFGRELWKTTGTDASTVRVKDILPGSASSAPDAFVSFNGQLYFRANDGTGAKLFRSDGTEAGTTVVVNQPAAPLLSAGGLLYFVGSDPAHGAELWATDGSPAGTYRVSDANPGTVGGITSTAPGWIGAATPDGRLFFAADDGSIGNELWTTDGTPANTRLVKDLNTTPAPVTPLNLTTFKGDLYFTTSLGGLYRTDGTPGSAIRLDGLTPTRFAVTDDWLYFATGDSSNNPILWKTDGTREGTTRVREFSVPSPYAGSIRSLFGWRDRAYFAWGDPGQDTTLWTTDGTAAGTGPLRTQSGPVNPREFHVAGDRMYFVAQTGGSYAYLWSTDGTSNGTISLGGPNLGTYSFSQGPSTDIEHAGGVAYFVGKETTVGQEIYRTNGTPQGTGLILNIDNAPYHSVQLDPENASRSIGTLDGAAFFFGPNGLWKTDGTAAGTALLKAVDDDYYPMYGMAKVGNKLFFVNQHAGEQEADLWVTDGSAAGTRLLRRFFTDRQQYQPLAIGDIVDVGGVAYFSVRDPGDGGGTELWRSDGTPAGTTPVADVNPGAAGSNPAHLTVIDQTLYATADDGAHGVQVWKFTPPAFPSTPANVAATAVSPFRVRVTWNDPSNDEAGFRIERSTSPAFATVDNAFAVRPDVTTFTDPIALPGRTYYYRVVAFNGAGASPSAAARADTPAVANPAGVKSVDPALVLSGNTFAWRGQLYFSSYSYEKEQRLSYRTDGDVTEPAPFNAANTPVQLGDRVYYLGFRDFRGELWSSDGTIQNTTLIKTLPQGSTRRILAYNGRIYFAAPQSPTGIWTSDGTEAGTVPVASITDTRLAVLANWMAYDSSESELDVARVGEDLYYTAATPRGLQLFKTDGVTTTQLTDYYRVSNDFDFYPRSLSVAHGTVYFFAQQVNPNTSSWRALWKTDGTPAGTVQVKVLDGVRYQRPTPVVAANGTLFFTEGYHLWASDGTTAGTSILKAFDHYQSPSVMNLTVVGGRLYFAYHLPTGSDPQGRDLYRGELWTSDGTAAGTTQVPGLPFTEEVRANSPAWLTAVDGTLYFTADPAARVVAGDTVFRYTPPPLPLATPAAPTAFTATADNARQVTLAWADAANNEAGYRLERSRSADFASVDVVVHLLPNTTHYVDRDLFGGTTYYYRLVAYNTGGDSPAANAGPVTTPAGPEAPTGFTAVQVVPGERIDLAWTDNATGETGYVLQRSTNPDFYPAGAITLTAHLPAGATSYVDTAVSRLTTYYYRVYAVGDGGNSAAAAASLTTTESKPFAPSDLLAVGVSATGIDLQWADNAPNEGAAVGFRVERAAGDADFDTIAQLPANTTTYTDTGLQPGTTYRYRVTALNAVGESAPVTSAAVRTLPPALTTPVQAVHAHLLDADPSAVVQVNGVGYFLATNRGFDPAQLQLWRTDGTPGGTSLVRTIGFATPGQIARAGDKVYFVSTAFTGETQLWVSDGTIGGTAIVRTLYTVDFSTAARPSVGEMADVNGTLFYTLLEPTAAQGGTLWRSDGTGAGTTPIKTFATAWPRHLLVHTATLYFDAAGTLYASDGTPAGTLPTSAFVPGQGAYERVTVGGNTYYTTDAGLFVNTGDPGADTLLATSPVGRPAHLSTIPGGILFVTRETSGAVTYSDLWFSDGTPGGAAVRLRRFDYGGAPGITATRRVGDTAYFTLAGPAGAELWKTDGTPAGTALVRTMPPGGNLTHLGEAGGRLTFTAGEPTQLWASDGTAAGTTQVSQIGAATRPSHPDFLTVVGPDLFFVTSPLTSSTEAALAGGRELWKTDGATGRNVRLYVGRNVRDLTDVNGTLYFIDATAIWKTDGTAAGTLRVVDLPYAGARLVAALGDTLFFAFNSGTGTGSYQLWKTDGTAAGTARVSTATVYLYLRSDLQQPVARSGNWLYFLDGNNAGQNHGGGLWRTDGVTTQQVSGLGQVEHLADVNGTLFAVGRPTGRNAYSLFKVDAAGPASAALVRDLFDYVSSGMPVDLLTRVGNHLYFSAVDRDNGWVVWRSDGTAAGTTPVFDPVQDTVPSQWGRAYMIRDVGGVAYVLSADAYNSAPGPAGWLWRTDGTAAGTRRIRAVNVPAISPYGARPLFAAAVDGKLIYSDGNHLWRSDGTIEGTVQIDQIGVDPDGERSPAVFGGAAHAVVGDRIYFSGAVDGGNRELRVAFLQPPAAPDGLDVTPEPAPEPAPVAAPAPAGAAPAATAGNRLTWVDRSDRESGFVIERSASPDFAAVDATFFAPANATTYLDTTAAPGTRYFYRVRALNAGGESANSNLTTAGAPAVLGASFDFAAANQRLVLRFSADVAAALAAALAAGGGLTLTNLTTGQAVPASAFTLSTSAADNSITLTFAGALTDGNYRLRLAAADVRGSAGAPLDGDGDGTGGDDYTFDFFQLAGDANRDRTVDFQDLVTLAQNYNATGKTYAQGDFNGDGAVDFNDMVLLAQRYNTTLPPAPAPEPAPAPALAAAPVRGTRPAPKPVFSVTPVTRAPAPRADSASRSRR